MILIGLTGNAGSGKSTVGNILRELQHTVIDVDLIVDELYELDEVQAEIHDVFGPCVFKDGAADKDLLRTMIFSQETAKAKIEQIFHPRVHRTLAHRVAEHKHEELVFIEHPLIYEKGLVSDFDQVWLCHAPRDVKMIRLAERGLSLKGASNLLANQIPSEQSVSKADIVIDTTKPLESMKVTLAIECARNKTIGVA